MDMITSMSTDIDNMATLPNEVIGTIFQNINPRKLHNIANKSKHARYIVNNHMCRSEYIEKWLDMNMRNTKYWYYISESNIEYELDNYWYFILQFKDNTYPLLLKHIKKVKNHSLSCNSIVGMTDVSHFAGVHSLSIYNCCLVADISKLANVHALTVVNCINIHDISMLGGLYYLDISYCFGIKDVSALGRVHILKMKGYVCLKGMENLGGVHTLCLAECKGIYGHVKYFADVYDLDISNTDVTDINMLGKLHRLNADGCKELYNINMELLSNIEDFSCEYLSELDIEHLEMDRDEQMISYYKNVYSIH